MSLIELSLSDVVKKQYKFKLRAFFGSFSSLAFMQLLGLLFSLGGSGGMGFSSEHYSIHISYYSAEMVIVFTLLWAFLTAILITAKAARFDDFSFVSNRISSNIANALFLVTASVIGGTSAILSGYLLRVITYFTSDVQYGVNSGLLVAPKEFFLGISATILYVLLFSSIGYMFGMLVQINKIFIVLLPCLIIGSWIFLGITNEGMIKPIFDFIFRESVFSLFFIKIIGISGLLFAGAAALSNRMEVRK
ncbi:hypothetical protein [Lederbergia citri]|uniref:Uncharacterized protein n=1 Tax=Lederbergia citri TaxID=2833580 RepID=A0A942THH6_9BACI|nr:hypothetical protein [Lederbergia citri]MBS4196861.1 hypothetical protein [Lederbergia citri]